MKTLNLSALSLLLFLNTAGLAQAQSAPDLRDILKETGSSTATFNCTASKSMFESNNKLGGLDAIFNFDGDSGKGTKTFKTYTREAAQRALDNGYNYAIMAPLSIGNYRNQREVVYYGWGVARKGTQYGDERRSYNLGCTGLDDVAAFDLMWDARTEESIGDEGTLIDLRLLNDTLDLGLTVPARSRKIHDIRYKIPGDRERIAAQFDVKQKSASCRTPLSPVSLRQFKPSDSARNRAEETACLEKYRAEAKAVDWDRFPLFVKDTKTESATRGYVLNRPDSTDPKSDEMDNALWGKGWVDLSDDFQSASDLLIHNPSQNLLLIASQNLTETEAIDRAVFLTSDIYMSEKKTGIALNDKTSYYRGRFDTKARAMTAKRLKNAERANRSSGGISDRKIEYKQRDIARAEERLNELRAGDDEATIAQMKAAVSGFPGAEFDADEMRKQLKDVRDANIKARESKLTKLRSELAEMTAQQANERSAQATQNAQGQAKATQNIRPSEETATTSADKGIYRAFETYSTVFIVKTNSLSASSRCRDDYLVCADKLQAYNALGDQVGKSGFTPLSLPVGYEPYEMR